MASSPSTLLKLELMADGENSNTWGQKTNANLSLLENAIAKRQAVTLGGVDVTLTDTDYADNQARSLCLALTGTVSANVNVIVPSRSKMYLVDNGTSGSFTVSVKTAAGSAVACPQGKITIVYVTGADVKGISVSGAVDADTLDGIDSSAFARLNARNQFTKGTSNSVVGLTDGATVDVDMSLGEFFRVVIGGNRTFTFSNVTDGSVAEIYVVEDGTGGRTVTWPANIVWQGGAAPVLSTAANSVNRIVLRYYAASAIWYGVYNTGLVTSGGGGSTISDITLTGSSGNVDVYALAGSPAGAVTFTLTIATGVLIYSNRPNVPALDLTGFASGSVIGIINNGKIIGAGGRGGRGGSATATGDGNFAFGGGAGEGGGSAILHPGSGRTVNITNASGFIFGGGGGGGGGGVAVANGDNIANGGGGGGGAGLGEGAAGGILLVAEGTTATAGVSGTHGTAKTNGTGGTGTNGGTGSGGTAGNGGDFGAVGTAGASPSNTVAAGGGAAGAAGKAVDLNGGSVTFVSGNDGTHVKGAVS